MVNLTNNSTLDSLNYANYGGENFAWVSGNTFPLSNGQSGVFKFGFLGNVNTYQLNVATVGAEVGNYMHVTDSNGNTFCVASAGSQLMRILSGVYANCTAPINIIVNNTPC